jgi:hypothetical protein
MMKVYKKVKELFQLEKALFPVLVGLFMSVGSTQLNAQLVATIGSGTNVSSTTQWGSPIYRSSTSSSFDYAQSVQLLTASDLASAGIFPGATITKLAYKKTTAFTMASGRSATYRVYAKNSTATALTTGLTFATWTTGSTLVYENLSMDDTDIPAVADSWVELNFTTPFVYTGGSIEFALDWAVNPGTGNRSTGAFQWEYTTVSNMQSVGWSASSAPTASTSLTTGASFLYNCQLTYQPAMGTDLAISEFISPEAACPGSTDVTVAILNASSEDIDTATIAWTLNGVLQGSVTYTGNLLTGDTAHVNLGNFTSVAGNLYDIEAYITYVGPGTDTTSNNDTLGIDGYRAALSGVYTIDAGLPPSATNFQSFQDATDALNQYGVCSSTTFNVASGIYNEQIEIGDVPGSSATNTISFVGAGAANTTLIFEQNVSDDRYTVRLDGTSFITFEDLTIEADDDGTYGWAMHLTNGAHDVIVQNCSIVTHSSSTSTFFNGIVVSGSNTGYTTGGSDFENIDINNNAFVGGYNAIRINGLSASKATGIEVVDNTFDQNRWAGVYLNQCEDVLIHNNHMNGQSGITAGAGIYLTTVDFFEITENEIYNQGQYGMYLNIANGTSTDPALVANNVIAGVGGTTDFASAIRVAGNSNFIDIVYNSCLMENGNGRVFQVTVSTPDDLRLLNNSFVLTGNGNGYAMYVSSESVIGEIDHNNYYSDGSNFVYYGSARADLSALQAVNTPTGNDANSVTGDPLYTASNDLMPLGPVLNNVATPFPGITTDISGQPRNATTPDIGAYEYAPLTDDLALTEGELIAGQCLSTNDTVMLTIVYTIGSSRDLSIDPITATWNVTGPVNSNGTVVFNAGTILEGDTITAFSAGVDMSEAGTYELNAYIDSTSLNQVPGNDTLLPPATLSRPVEFAVSPISVTLSSDTDTVEVSASSSLLPGGDVFISEICHWRGSTNGAPSGGWPTYMVADDYIELTGVPNSDIGGITLEQWSSSSMTSTYTFPSGTMLSPQGTAIIAVGQMGSSVESPSNFYYHGNGSFTGSFSSTQIAGRILRDASGNIIDAVGHGTYTFPAAAGVTASDWSGNTPALSSAGNRLEGSYTKDATNWENSGSGGTNNGQDPNVVNQNVTVPTPQLLTGFSWSMDGVVIDTVPSTWVGPFAVPGTYYAVATFNSPCGVLVDSVEIVVTFPYCDGADSLEVSDGCEEVEVSWVSGPDVTASNIEYGPFGFTSGTGTMLSGVTSPVMVTGLTPNTDYDLYVKDSCSGNVPVTVSNDSTYLGSITSEYNTSPTTSSMSSCAGSLVVTIPAGATIVGVDVEYSITTGSGAYMSEQESYIRCISPGGVAETSMAVGLGNTGGTFSYNRTGLTIANGVTGGGNIEFELHNFRTWGGSACTSGYNDVDSSSWKVTVHYADTAYNETVEYVTFTTSELPSAGTNFTFVHDGSGGYDFVSDGTTSGNLVWDFGDGNSATGDSVSHQYTSEGTYTVLLIAENACGTDTISETIVYVSVESFVFANIAIYPNPNTGVFALDNLPVEGGKTTVILNDMQGRTVFTNVYQEGRSRIEMNIGNLRAGTYYITLSNDLGQVTRPVMLVK